MHPNEQAGPDRGEGQLVSDGEGEAQVHRCQNGTSQKSKTSALNFPAERDSVYDQILRTRGPGLAPVQDRGSCGNKSQSSGVRQHLGSSGSAGSGYEGFTSPRGVTGPTLGEPPWVTHRGESSSSGYPGPGPCLSRAEGNQEPQQTEPPAPWAGQWRHPVVAAGRRRRAFGARAALLRRLRRPSS